MSHILENNIILMFYFLQGDHVVRCYKFYAIRSKVKQMQYAMPIFAAKHKGTK